MRIIPLRHPGNDPHLSWCRLCALVQNLGTVGQSGGIVDGHIMMIAVLKPNCVTDSRGSAHFCQLLQNGAVFEVNGLKLVVVRIQGRQILLAAKCQLCEPVVAAVQELEQLALAEIESLQLVVTTEYESQLGILAEVQFGQLVK
jgi:hypothetical protein